MEINKVLIFTIFEICFIRNFCFGCSLVTTSFLKFLKQCYKSFLKLDNYFQSPMYLCSFLSKIKKTIQIFQETTKMLLSSTHGTAQRITMQNIMDFSITQILREIVSCKIKVSKTDSFIASVRFCQNSFLQIDQIKYFRASKIV